MWRSMWWVCVSNNLCMPLFYVLFPTITLTCIHIRTQLRFFDREKGFFLRAVNNDLSHDHKEQLLQFLSYLNALIQIFGDELVN